MEAEGSPAGRGSRPIAITILCAFMAIGTVAVVPLILSEAARHIGSWYPPLLAASAIVGFVSMIGLWLMRKWAVYLYLAGAVVNQAVALFMGIWNIFALVIPGIAIAVMLLYVGRMR